MIEDGLTVRNAHGKKGYGGGEREEKEKKDGLLHKISATAEATTQLE